MCSSSSASCFSFGMKDSNLDCGMNVAIPRSKKTGFGLLTTFLSLLENASSSLSVIFLLRELDEGVSCS